MTGPPRASIARGSSVSMEPPHPQRIGRRSMHTKLPTTNDLTRTLQFFIMNAARHQFRPHLFPHSGHSLIYTRTREAASAMTRSPRTSALAAALSCASVLLVGCISSPPDEQPPAPPSRGVEAFDPSGHPLGAKWVWSEFDKVEPFLAELEGGNTYVEVVLCEVQETPGVFDWSVPDSQVSRARDVGFGSLVKLRTGRCWATPGEAKYERGYKAVESAMPADMGVYTDFVEQSVRRYTALGVTEFAIENEVNSPYFWDGTPEEYATLARAAGQAIHAAAPNARVVDGSVSSAGAGFAVAEGLLSQGRETEAVTTYQIYYSRRFGTREGSASIDEVTSAAELRAELARPGPARAISFMRAIDGLFAEGVFQTRQVHYYEPWQALPATLAHIRDNTPSTVPLEMWELGIWDDERTVSEDERTAEVVRATTIALGAGVEKVLWLPLLDNPDGRLGATLYGLVTPSGEARGSSSAYALMAKAAAHHSVVAPITAQGLTGATFDSTRPTMIVWATAGETDLPTIPGASGTVLDAQTEIPATGPAATRVGSQPVLITTSGPVSVFEEIAK